MAKNWFITGTSRGFGREWAIAALERGDRVAATARNLESLSDLADKYGENILPLELDVTDREADFAAVARAHDFRVIQRALGIEPIVIRALSRTRRHFGFRFERPLEKSEPTSAYRSHLRIASGGNSYYLPGSGSLTGSEGAKMYVFSVLLAESCSMRAR